MMTEEHKIKIAKSNTGVKRSAETCINIGKSKEGNKFWLGKKHTIATKVKISNSLIGVKHSDSRKEKTSKANIKYWSKITKLKKLERTKNWSSAGTIAAQKANPSSIEKLVCKVLDSLNIKYETQKSFCHKNFIVDIFIPAKMLIIECNGDYWHNLPYKMKRDGRLQSYCDKYGYKLIWLWEKDINTNASQLVEGKLMEVI